VGVWGSAPHPQPPNPQAPIPNPQQTLYFFNYLNNKLIKNFEQLLIYALYN